MRAPCPHGMPNARRLQPVGRGAARPARAVTQARAVPGQRHLAARLQPGGERHPAVRRWTTQRVVRGHRGRRQGQCQPVFVDRDCQDHNIEPYRGLVVRSRSCRWPGRWTMTGGVSHSEKVNGRRPVCPALDRWRQEGKDCTRTFGHGVARTTVPDGIGWLMSYRVHTLCGATFPANCINPVLICLAITS
jgi:hypothetical protein